MTSVWVVTKISKSMVKSVFDSKMFETLFHLHFVDLMGFVNSYVKDEEVAKDIVHDVFLVLWNNRKRLDFSYSMKSYLFTLSRNYALNYLKHLRVVASNEREMTAFIESTNDELEQREKRLFRLHEKLLLLPQKQQEILKKCFIEGKGYKDVAEEFGISLNTVKTHLSRALKFLREEMHDEVVLFFCMHKKIEIGRF